MWPNAMQAVRTQGAYEEGLSGFDVQGEPVAMTNSPHRSTCGCCYQRLLRVIDPRAILRTLEVFGGCHEKRVATDPFRGARSSLLAPQRIRCCASGSGDELV